MTTDDTTPCLLQMRYPTGLLLEERIYRVRDPNLACLLVTIQTPDAQSAASKASMDSLSRSDEWATGEHVIADMASNSQYCTPFPIRSIRSLIGVGLHRAHMGKLRASSCHDTLSQAANGEPLR